MHAPASSGRRYGFEGQGLDLLGLQLVGGLLVSAVRTTSVRVIADEVYEGTRWQDLSLSEIWFEGDSP